MLNHTFLTSEATWTSWTSWGSCSETCGSGLRTRQRNCLNPVAGQTCSGSPTDSQHCYIQECIDPIWLNWGPWAACSVTCGDGTRTRERICSHSDVNACFQPGSILGPVETGGCNDFPCDEPVWRPWTEWSECSATCGGGSQFRDRQCQDPYPFDTNTCEGEDISQWQRWGDWSDCSVDCNGGVRQRTRECYNPGYLAPACPGSSTTVETCNLDRCPEYWDVWGPWGQCSTTCGPGTERRERSCVDPNPDDGIGCQTDLNGYDYYQTRMCNIQDCAGWSQWMAWTPCTASCGTGIRQRFRTCNNPNPFIFEDCPGGNTDTDPNPCSVEPCPEWNNWGSYGDCSVTCGGGTRERIRTCYDPDRTDEATCVGQPIGLDPVPCNLDPCEGPIVAWSAWSPWTGCSRTCGIGLQQRVRTCQDPDRTDDVTCINGDRADSRVCSGIECVFPEWNEWQPWTCSVTCGGGKRARFRTCNDPYPEDEDVCLGSNIEQDPFECNTDACPVQCQLWRWYKERRRICYVPPTLPPSSYCIGIDVQPDGGPCNSQACPVIIPPQWNNWGPWDYCSVTCGGGIRERTRDCNDPDPFDFTQCQGPASERDPTLCNRDECPQPPVWNEWQPWGGCSLPCGGGEQVRIRTCYDEQPNDGRFCAPGNSIQSQDCNTQVCAAWSPWNTWSACTVECGGGDRRRERNCNSVDSAYTCPGANYDNTDCNPEACPKKTNIGLTVGLIAAALLLAAIVGAICFLLFCRKRRPAVVVYKDPPTPLPTPPPSPRVRRVVEEVELVPEKPKTRWVARRVPGVRAVVREEEKPVIRVARTVRPALYVDGNYDQPPRYVRSVGDRVLLDGGRYPYEQRKVLDGISNSFI
ncbi:A disintegrin and metalloproteinase with thrombospondin motifs adt-1-like [Amphiura filiformis]|uniref:A disintegrin and metalloproteinase with thrombospondin motifs adt-1-like n=1 Tax=Amphiura filiformis TaxID=82378 RepID=UPI003B218F83